MIFIYYLFILFIYLFVSLFRYINFFMLFILQFFFDLTFSFLYVDMCMCESAIDGDLRVVLDGSSFWADWHHCILYSTHHSSLPEKELIMTRIQKKILEPKCNLSNYNNIHIFMVGFHGNK